MISDYLAAAFQVWATSKTNKGWREFWRLKKLGIRWQLRNTSSFGPEIELKGPVIIRNKGTFTIGRQAVFNSNWYKPIYLSINNENAKLTIEKNVRINYGTEISLVDNVFIGAFSQISIDCLIYDTDWHSLDGLDREIPVAPVHIGRGVWLGARVVVLKGVHIGDNTVVAANSLVTKDLPSCVLAGGSPAKVLRSVKRFRYIPGMEDPQE